MNYFSNICRICMSRDIELLNIYQSDDDMLTYIDKLNTCIPEIFTEKNYTPLPDQICELCCKNLKISFWFRELCLKSNTLFRAYKFKLEAEPPQQLDVRLNEDKCEPVTVKKEPDIDCNSVCSVNSVELPKSPVQVMVEGDVPSGGFSDQFIKSEDDDSDEEKFSKEITQSPDIFEQKLNSSAETSNSIIDYVISDDDSNINNIASKEDFSDPKLHSTDPTPSLALASSPQLSCTPELSLDPKPNSSSVPVLEAHMDPPQNKFDNEQCPELEMNIVEQVTLALVEETVKVESPKMRHLCPYCGKPFKFRQDMRIHERMHTGYKPYICHICNKSFAKNTRLKVHINTHTREKAYTCTFCNKIFNQNSNLIMHMKLHTQTERFACNLCEKTFSQKRHLKQHILFHEDEKRYTCEICNWNFTMKHHLKRHLMTHTGQRPQRKEMPKDRERKFPCEKCEWSFMSKEVLKRHMLVHTKDNPKLRTSLNDEKRRFPCPLCEWSFTKKHHLERHMCKHDDRKFVCHLCKEEFKKNYELQRHLKAHAQIPLGFKIQTY